MFSCEFCEISGQLLLNISNCIFNHSLLISKVWSLSCPLLLSLNKIVAAANFIPKTILLWSWDRLWGTFPSLFIIALEFDVIQNDENYVIGGHETQNICFYKRKEKHRIFWGLSWQSTSNNSFRQKIVMDSNPPDFLGRPSIWTTNLQMQAKTYWYYAL